jgi:hypothetical protein
MKLKRLRTRPNPSKFRTLEQAAAAQKKAVRFAADVLEDDDKANELESLTVEEYADRKRLHIVTSNPRKKTTPMPKSRAQLIEENSQLQEEVEDLNLKLDQIISLAAPDDDECDDDEDADDEDEE